MSGTSPAQKNRGGEVRLPLVEELCLDRPVGCISTSLKNDIIK